MKEIRYFEATDGTRFKTAEECEQYETSTNRNMTMNVSIHYRQITYIPYKLKVSRAIIDGWDNLPISELRKIEEELSKQYGYGDIVAIETEEGDMIYED